MSNENLLNYYKTNFAMVQHHKYSLTELEEMMPFERDIYITLLAEYIKEENERQRLQQAQIKSRRK
jgi:hypothetical protein